MIKWIDEKSVLKVGKELFKAGDIIPADALSEKRIELFKSLKQLEVVEKEVAEVEKQIKIKDKPKAKAKSEVVDDA